MLPRITPPTDEPHLTLAPLVDVSFQLVLFFLLTFRFASIDERIDIALPKDT